MRATCRSCSKRSSVAALLLGLLAVALPGCTQHGSKLPQPIHPSECSSTSFRAAAVFLVGDAGAPSLPGPDQDPALLVDPVLRALRTDVERALAALPRSRVAVIYLGDNVYQHGLRAGEEEQHGLTRKGHAERAHGEAVLNAQIRAASVADLYFVLGNHDWNKADPVDAEGLDRAQEQGRYVSAHDSRAEVVPPAGCAGPSGVDFGVNLRFVFVDAMGWALMGDEPGAVPPECRYRTTDEVAEALQHELANTDHRTILFAMHHPLRMAGPHGGHFTWKQHLFPLTDFWPNAWIPLPVIGSAYPLSRQLGVTNTDLSHESYRKRVKSLTELQRPNAPALWAAGHEHSLQVHRDQSGALHAVSGAGSVVKVNRVEDLEGMLMGVAAPGYMRLDEYADHSLRLTVTALDEEQYPREVYQICAPGRQK